MKSEILNNKSFALLLPIIFALSATTFAQTTEFTYQGKLLDGALGPTANYDFEFRLFSVDTGGAAIITVQRLNVAVANGLFNVKLDFGANFNGGLRWLEVAVRPAGGGAFTTLAPRQSITSAPYAIRSLNAQAADTATNALQLGNVAASQYVITTDARLADERIPLPGSANYIQNSTNQQASSNFSISGNGTLGGTLSANAVNTVTQFNISSARVLSAAGSNNIFVGNGAGLLNSGSDNAFFGRNAGVINTTGSNNVFFGSSSGFKNTTGQDNTFVGYRAGLNNTTAFNNTFVGSLAGQMNSTGSDNAFFGIAAGELNTTGLRNSFFGGGAGHNNQTANDNAFFGNAAGYSNIMGQNNAFLGGSAGFNNTVGSGNTFFGQSAGTNNTTGNNNTLIGQGANTSTENLTNATAIGAGAQVSASNTMVLGTNVVTVQTPGNLNVSGNLIVNGTLSANLPGGDGSYIQNRNTQQAGNANFNINGNGTLSGTLTADHVSTDTFFASGIVNTTSQYNIDGNAVVSRNQSGHTVISSTSGFVNVAGTLVADGFFSANGGATIDGLVVAGDLTVTAFTKIVPTGNGVDDLCLNNNNLLALCSSSLRYKTTIQPFTSGLEVVKRLRPIAFVWKDSGTKDVGFGAEEVEGIEPLLVTYRNGQIEGVKYRQLTTVLVNAVNEQQAQIEKQQEQNNNLQEQVQKQQAEIREQQKQLQQQQDLIDGLKKLVCQNHSQAEVCKP